MTNIIINLIKAFCNIMDFIGYMPNPTIVPRSIEEVIEHIVLAQIASDGGKGIDRFCGLTSTADAVYEDGYGSKDIHILAAIIGIEALHLDSVKWFISSDWEEEIDWDDEPEMRSIIYFEWEGKQISFHSFSMIWKQVVENFGWKYCEWDERSSAETAMYMAYHLAEVKYGEWSSHDAKERLVAMVSYLEETNDTNLEYWRLNEKTMLKRMRRFRATINKRSFAKKKRAFDALIESRKKHQAAWWKGVRAITT